MDEHHAKVGGDAYDSEIRLKPLVGFVLGLIGVTVLALLAMWAMSSHFKALDESHDPPPSPLAEARQDPIAPGPRLQSSPPRDMAEMRARDREALTTYGWVDRNAGIAHIPVDRAIAILAQKAPAPPKQEGK